MYALMSAVSAFIADRFDKKDRGATAVEYGLMVALIAIVIIVAVALIGTNLTAVFNDVADELTGVAPAAP